MGKLAETVVSYTLFVLIKKSSLILPVRVKLNLLFDTGDFIVTTGFADILLATFALELRLTKK